MHSNHKEISNSLTETQPSRSVPTIYRENIGGLPVIEPLWKENSDEKQKR
jgi:hypothetical protein